MPRKTAGQEFASLSTYPFYSRYPEPVSPFRNFLVLLFSGSTLAARNYLRATASPFEIEGYSPAFACVCARRLGFRLDQPFSPAHHAKQYQKIAGLRPLFRVPRVSPIFAPQNRRSGICKPEHICLLLGVRQTGVADPQFLGTTFSRKQPASPKQARSSTYSVLESIRPNSFTRCQCDPYLRTASSALRRV